MTLLMKYTHCSGPCPEWATPDHVIIHVQFSSVAQSNCLCEANGEHFAYSWE